MCTLSSLLALLPAGALVLLRLLGPFTAMAGQPITLCWRLERSVAGAGAEEPLPLSPRHEDVVPLQYEVLAEVRIAFSFVLSVARVPSPPRFLLCPGPLLLLCQPTFLLPRSSVLPYHQRACQSLAFPPPSPPAQACLCKHCALPAASSRRARPQSLSPNLLACLAAYLQGDSWRPLGRRSGRVSLGAQAGAVSTVEATWVPLLQGTLPVPTLRIQEVRCQVCGALGGDT